MRRAALKSLKRLISRRARSLQLLAAVAALAVMSASPVQAEWYVAGQFGLNFADRIKDVQGTNGLAGAVEHDLDFDLKNSYAYGVKLGNFPDNGWFGVELDAFHSTPHIKNLGASPGIHMRVTTVGINFIARYPGETFQPYAGIGAAVVVGRISDSIGPTPDVPGTRHSSDVSSGLNLLGGIRAFVTPYVAVFTEYKFTQSTLRYDQAFGSTGGFVGDYQAQQLLVGVSYHF